MFGCRRLLSGLVLGVLLASCSSFSDSAATSAPVADAGTPMTATTVIPSPWAQEAEFFVAGLRDAMSGSNPESVAAFYHPDAVHENTGRHARLEGREEILEFFGWFSEVGEAAGAAQLFVTAGRAAVMVEEVETRDVTTGFTDLRVYDIAEGLISFESIEFPMPLQSARGLLSRARAAEMLTLYERYVTAWDSGDPARIQSVYGDGAARFDGLFGGSVVLGEDWAASIAQHLRPAAEDIDYEPVSTSFQDYEETVTGAVFTPSSGSDPVIAHALFNIRNSAGCPLRLLAEWELDDFRILREEIFYEVASVRLCSSKYGPDVLPDGWWTGLALPELVEEVTGRVTTGTGEEIAISNGGRRQIELVEWALGRFELAGLPAPRLDLAGFPPNRLCVAGDYAGVASFDESSARIYMCLEENEVCLGPTCDSFRPEARLGLLHEMGHVWEFQNLDNAARQAFLAQRGLEVWSDGKPDWAGASEEGIEHAAEILAWGLMDEALPLIRIPDATPDDLAAGFRLLSGLEPLVQPPE